MTQKSFKKNYCTNCGKFGHYFKLCKDPVTSLGIVCFKFDEMLNINIHQLNNFLTKKYIEIDKFNFEHLVNLDKLNFYKDKIKFLMIRRKHSLNYIEFIRGRYNKTDIKKLTKMFELMSPEEINSIDNLDFSTLWNNLWKKTSNHKIYQKEYQKSSKSFEYLKNTNILSNLIKIKPKYNTPEWGFPKGRRNSFEKNMECAMREFNEETYMETDDYIILNNIFSIQENYIGTNNIEYRHIYYLAVSSSDTNITTLSFSQNYEIGKIAWLNWEEALTLIRPYYISKIELLNKIYLFILNLYEETQKYNQMIYSC